MAFDVRLLNLPVIRIGSDNYSVRAWQSFLKEKEYPVQVIDGDFGNITKQATILYQQRNSLEADGIVGNATYSKASPQGFIFKIPNS